MPRNQPPSQPSHASGRRSPDEDFDREDFDPDDREPSASDERAANTRALRDDNDDDGELAYLHGSEQRRPPSRDDDEEEALAVDDIMEVLDLDDLQRMEGPDA
jgi:hypothetical protein